MTLLQVLAQFLTNMMSNIPIITPTSSEGSPCSPNCYVQMYICPIPINKQLMTLETRHLWCEGSLFFSSMCLLRCATLQLPKPSFVLALVTQVVFRLSIFHLIYNPAIPINHPYSPIVCILPHMAVKSLIKPMARPLYLQSIKPTNE